MALDALDRDILGELSIRGRLSWRELGERVGLGASATAERVRRLENEGVISGYRAQIDPESIGRGLQALIDIRLGPAADSDEFQQSLADAVEVMSAVHVTGPFDYVVHVACRGVSDLDRLVRGWKGRFGGETSTRVMLNVVPVDGLRRQRDLPRPM